MSDDLEAFGYVPEPDLIEIQGAQVAEGKHAETLHPLIVLRLRETPETPQVGFVMHLELAEFISAELTRWIARAREKHFE